MATGRQVYDALMDAWLARAQGGCVLSYSIAGKNVTFESLDALMRAVSKSASMAQDEEIDVGAYLVQLGGVLS